MVWQSHRGVPLRGSYIFPCNLEPEASGTGRGQVWRRIEGNDLCEIYNPPGSLVRVSSNRIAKPHRGKLSDWCNPEISSTENCDRESVLRQRT